MRQSETAGACFADAVGRRVAGNDDGGNRAPEARDDRMNGIRLRDFLEGCRESLAHAGAIRSIYSSQKRNEKYYKCGIARCCLNRQTRAHPILKATLAIHENDENQKR